MVEKEPIQEELSEEQQNPQEVQPTAEEVPEKDKKKKKEKKNPAGEELEKTKQELADQKQQYLRILAEYDNFRKRSQAEKNAVYGTAVADTVQEILPVVDNIERALSQENASAEDMRKGVEMIETQIRESFEKLGIKSTGQAGDAFDPLIHNAVSHIDDESLGENVIAAVYQKGYLLGDKVVRHAMVQVAN